MIAYVTDVYYTIALESLKTGGGTWARDAAREHKPDRRYVVALGGKHSRKINASEGAEALPHIVHALRELADDRAAWIRGEALGTWVDQENQNFYVDVVTSHDDLNVALYLAKFRGELAIWDSLEGKEIRV